MYNFNGNYLLLTSANTPYRLSYLSISNYNSSLLAKNWDHLHLLETNYGMANVCITCRVRQCTK